MVNKEANYKINKQINKEH